MNEEAIKALYDEMSTQYDVGSLDDFKKYLSDDNMRAMFFDEAIKGNYDVESQDEFDAFYGFKKKEDGELSTQEMPSESEPPEDFLGIAWGHSIKSGIAQGRSADETMKLIIDGASASDQDIEAYIKAVEEMDKYQPTEGMRSFQKKYQEEGGDIGAFFSALGSNLDVAPEVLLQSVAGMIATATSGGEIGAAVTGGAAVGAGTGALLAGGVSLGAGAGIGAAIGGVKGATSVANGIMETSVSMTEFMREKLQEEGKEFNAQNIREILNNEEAFDDIKYRAIARGGSIAAFDLLGGGVAASATAKVGKQALKVGSKTGRYVGEKLGKTAGNIVEGATVYAIPTVTSFGLEGTFGAGGEMTARALAGQEMDAAEIGLEGTVGAITGGPVSLLGVTTWAKPQYKLRGQNVSLANITRAMNDPEMLRKGNIEIKNNDALKAEYEAKLKEALLEDNLPDDVKGKGDVTEKIKEHEKTIEENKNKNTYASQKKVEEAKASISSIMDGTAVEQEKEGPEMVSMELDYRRSPEVVDNRMGKAGLDFNMEGERKGMGNWYVEYEALNEDGQYVKESIAFASKKDASDFQKAILSGEENWKESSQATKESVERLKELTGQEEITGLTQSEIDQSIQEITKKDRAVRSKFRLEQILGKPIREVKAVDVASALKDQIRLQSKAARKAYLQAGQEAKEKAKAIKDATSKISSDVSLMIDNANIQGTVGIQKLKAIQNRLSKLNVLNDTKVSEYLAYVENVINKADYEVDYKTAEGLISKIKSKAKGEAINAELKESIEQLLSVPLEHITDIKQAIAIMQNVNNSMVSTRAPKGQLSPQETLDNGTLQAFLDTELSNIRKIREQELESLYEDLVGASPEGLTAAEMKAITMALREGNENPDAFNNEVKKQQYKEAFKKAFNVYSGLIKDMILNRKDPFTGESVLEDMSTSESDVLLDFIDMDVDQLDSPRDIAKAVDMLRGFMGNNSLGGMRQMNELYKGTIAHSNLKAEGKYGGTKMSKPGMSFAENFASLPILGELLFGDKARWAKIQRESGIADFERGKLQARKLSSNNSKAYYSRFKKTKPNGSKFMNAENMYERGMFGFLSRNVDGDDIAKSEEFVRRKNLISESIQLLKSSQDEKLRKMGMVYEAVYNKLGVKDAITSEDLSVDQINQQAVEQVRQFWGDVYDDFSRVALENRNTKLGKDLNYVSDIFKRVSSARGVQQALGGLESEIDAEGNYQSNKDGYIYDKETGRYKKSTRPNTLGGYNEDGKNNLNKRYVSLEFEKDQFSAFESAMVDTNTASAAARIKGFFRADSKNPLLEGEEMSKLLVDRVALFVRNSRGIYDSSQDPYWVKKANTISRLATTMSLAGPTQWVKQTVPPLVNSMINAGPSNLFAALKLMQDPRVRAFINNSGYGVAERGLQSTAEVVGTESEVEAALGKPEQLQAWIKKANNNYMKFFIQAGDSYVAKASFLAYYIEKVGRSGFDNINFEGEIDVEAAEYAQQQVDRQQNISDVDMGGAMFASKRASTMFIRRTLFPFANFVMNMKARTYADVKTALNENATDGERTAAMKSLSSLAVEAATFQAVSSGIRAMIDYSVREATDDFDTEEEKERAKKSMFRYGINNVVMDIISPAPIADGVVGEALNFIIPEDYEIFVGMRQEDYTDRLGMYGIPLEKASELYELGKMAATGEYENNYGKKIQISERGKNMAMLASALQGLNLTGLGTSDMGAYSRSLARRARKQRLTKPKDKGTQYYY